MPLSDLRNRWSLLRILAALLALLTLIGLTALSTTLNANLDLSADGYGAVYAFLPLAGNLWSILANAALLAVRLGRGPYHPGVDIALDLLGWGLNWTMGVLLLVWIGIDYAPGHASNVDVLCWEPEDEYDAWNCAAAKRVAGIEWTGGFLCVTVGCIHLALFVKACVENHRLRVLADRSGFMRLEGTTRA